MLRLLSQLLLRLVLGLHLKLVTRYRVMPTEPMQAQVYDPRVGFSADSYQVFSDAQQRVEEKVSLYATA